MRQTGAGTEDDASAFWLAAAIGGLLGGKLYYAVLYGDWHLLYNRAGIVFYGSLIGGAIALSWVIRRRKLPFWHSVDAIAPGLALGYGVGRIGCLLVGDDYGVPTSLPWGITFPEGPIPTTAAALQSNFGVEIPADVAPGELLAVHPTQIYETLAALAICLLGRSLLKRGLAPGKVALPVFGLLAVERFLVEFIRAKDDRYLGPLTVAQGISLLILTLLMVLWLRRRSGAATAPVEASG